MALKGTIKDFGIADIFQLIGHQAKTGVLILRDEIDEVRVYFQSGSVVRAESTSRPKSMLLGSMLINAEALQQSDLDVALAEQKRTLKKLGTVLVEMGLVEEPDLMELMRLQMSETVYRLFAWGSGTYEFEQSDTVAQGEGIDPIRAETILMEGLRMIDEWPVIRKKLPSYTIIPERVKPLPEPEPPKEELDFDVFAFDENNPEAQKPSLDIGPNERRVYDLVETGRDVQKLIHLSRLGEFETCRAVLSLVSAGYLRLAEKAPETGDLDTLQLPDRGWAWPPRLAAYAALAVVAIFLFRSIDFGLLGLDLGSSLRYRPPTAWQHLAQGQMQVIDRALEVYRLEHGRYPETLDELEKTALLAPRDLRFPYEQRYFYRVDGERYVLLQPLR